MIGCEAALQVMRTQVRFEWMQAAADVAHAAEVSAVARRTVGVLRPRYEAYRRELHEIMARPQANVALLDAMRRGLRAEQLQLSEWQRNLATAQQREQQARSALASLRNREHSLDRSLEAQRRRRQQQRELREMIQVDELWLQHSMRELL